MSQGIETQTGQYMHAQGAARRYKIGGTNYIIGIAGAYNAFGLIGPEHNGIFILDDDARRVVLDRHCEIPTGYFGPSPKQWAEMKRIVELPKAAFLNFCRNNPRYRGDI